MGVVALGFQSDRASRAQRQSAFCRCLSPCRPPPPLLLASGKTVPIEKITIGTRVMSVDQNEFHSKPHENAGRKRQRGPVENDSTWVGC